MFDTTSLLIAGALTGLLFGFMLQKARVTRYDTILGQFLFTDFTVLKVMLTAIVTGAVGIWAMYGLGWLEGLHIKSATLVANALGGAIFGVGMAVLGYCPGTGVAAIGEGSRHAVAGLLGMVLGAAVYAEVYPYIQNNLQAWADQGKVTFADLTGLSPWVFVAAMAVLSGVAFFFIERWERRKARGEAAPANAASADAGESPRAAHAHG